jgi:hypothetical protein
MDPNELKSDGPNLGLAFKGSRSHALLRPPSRNDSQVLLHNSKFLMYTAHLLNFRF